MSKFFAAATTLLKPAAHESNRGLHQQNLLMPVSSAAIAHRVRVDFTEFYASCSATFSRTSNMFGTQKKVA